MSRKFSFVVAALTLGLTPVLGGDIPARTLDPGDYESFVRNWAPKSAPLCAVLRSQKEWDAVFAPAPRMTPSRAFAPPAALWKDSAVIVIARVVNGGDTSHVFHLVRVRTDRRALDVAYTFNPTPPSSFTMKAYLAVVVPAPLPPTIRLTEGGRTVCKLTPTSGAWITPVASGHATE